MSKLLFWSIIVLSLNPQLLQGQVFTEVSESRGLPFMSISDFYTNIDGIEAVSLGNGISLYDWNVDGYDDLVLLNYDSFPRFFLNNQGFFEEVFFLDLQFTANFTSVCWVDIENDGDLDIGFNTQFDGYFLFENDGDFNFSNVALTSGIIPQLSNAYAQCWADYNLDGFIDLYLPYYDDGINTQNPTRNLLYKNNGDGSFTEVSGIAGVSDGYAKSLVAVWFDYDNDLWPDLFVLNDRVFFDNHLYKNNRDGTFTDVSQEAGVLYGIESMTGTVGDMNNDGNLDVFITNNAFGPALLHINQGNGTFSESGADYNVQLYQGGWAGVWIDYDNNMLQDLFVCTQPSPGDNYLFRNLETIFEIDNNSGLFGQSASLSAALGDINNDGAPDLVSYSTAPDGLQIWENNGTENNYLKIKLQGVVTNREAIGSW
ncbi:MAG: VCBS repeat-containing protein, partial [Bacteroidia bacterium]